MQTMTQSQSVTPTRSSGLVISYEWAAYAVLIALSLWLRVAELDVVPMSGGEATQALAAWRALHPHLPGALIVPDSPLLFFLHTVGFSFLGGTEFAARIFTALAGAALILSPLLFRDVLGAGRAFLTSLLLAFSPVLLVTSRLDSPVIWALWAALLTLWALRRWWLSGSRVDALLASSLLAALLFLTDPAGWLFALALFGAGAGALAWNRVDDPDHDLLPELRSRLNVWPWRQMLLAALLTVFSVGTVFLFYLPGVSAVAQLAQTGLNGLLRPMAAGAPPFFGLLTTLVYEPFIWLLGLCGFWLLARRGLNLADRFLALWVIGAGAALLIYQGSGPQHALWLIWPLTVLAAWTIWEAFQPDKHPFLDVPWWSKLVVGVSLFALLAILTINFQGMARAVLRSPDGSLSAIQPDPINTVWTVIALLFIIIGYFLVSSLWGAAAALRGGALGLMAFGMITSLGSGWTTAVTNADSPVVFWHVEATSRESILLRDTLFELSRRESGGFPYLTVYAVADDAGIMGWLLRDFVNVQYIETAEAARAQPVALLPPSDSAPALGGAYVGQTFVLTRTWSETALQGLDFLPWWTQGRVRTRPAPSFAPVLWLRQDIYDGVELNAN
jgi:predicted membrane-bound mannosyltransferase